MFKDGREIASMGAETDCDLLIVGGGPASARSLNIKNHTCDQLNIDLAAVPTRTCTTLGTKVSCAGLSDCRIHVPDAIRNGLPLAHTEAKNP